MTTISNTYISAKDFDFLYKTLEKYTDVEEDLYGDEETIRMRLCLDTILYKEKNSEGLVIKKTRQYKKIENFKDNCIYLFFVV